LGRKAGVKSGWIGDRSKKLYRHTMEMKQIMARLLAEIRTNHEEMRINQENMDANLKEMKASQEHLKEEMYADHVELMAIMKTGQEKIEAIVEVSLEKT
jgi:hypothetical protein